MNGCEECIAYRVRHNINKAGKCMRCGKDTLVWKQEKFGALYLECSECSLKIAVDLNTPCEMDPVFQEKVKLIIDPQKEMPNKNDIMSMTKEFEMNILQLAKGLKEGFSIEMEYDKFDKVIIKLKAFGVEYRTDNFVDLREKYPFYRECGYPYSAMQNCINNDNL